MEVEEANTSKNLGESEAGETTTVINESLLENTSNTDIESEQEITKSIPESNTREEEDVTVSVTGSEDSKAVAMVEVDEKVEDEKAAGVDVHCRNSQSVAALSGGIENSVVVESVNVVGDWKDDGDGAVKEVDALSDDVVAVESGGSELMCSVNVDGGDFEEVVVDRNVDQEVVEEKVENNGEDTNVGDVLVIENCVEEDDMINQIKNDDDANVQLEDVESVQEMVESDVRNDCTDVQSENFVNVEGDETMIEEQIVAEVVKEEGIVAKVVEEYGIVAEVVKEDETVAEVVKEDGIVAEVVKEDEIVAEVVKEEEIVAEVVKEDEVVVNEDGIVAEVVKEEEVVVEVVKEDETVAVVVNEDGIVSEVVMEEEIVADEVEEEEAVDVRENLKEEESLVKNKQKIDDVTENDEEETMIEQDEKSIDTEMETEKSVDTEMETEKSLDTEMENDEENLADEEKVQEEEDEDEEEEEEIETEPESSKKGKRKRGKVSKSTQKSPKKTIEEDVCFICFDTGELVPCDRRNCPKSYHPSCVNRDPDFFQSKGRWNCGWHVCSYCEKKAEYMCYTCTYSLCKACTKSQVILCVREKEKKGLCEPCMVTVMSIEKHQDQGNLKIDDNKDSWEHLFKDYWTETKAKNKLSLEELTHAKNPCKESGKQESPISKSRKSKRNTKKQKYESTVLENADWVSNELLEFVTHMRNGDNSVISQFEVQDLLLEYIKRNKLRDPNKKSQIICDARLGNLFNKPRVAHIEMLKLLEAHFLVKEDSQTDDVQGTVVDTEVSPIDKKRKGRRKGGKMGPQLNREDYGAIDAHNINLIYLRRKLVEDLLDDMEVFHDKIVGTFVRIRVSGVNQKQDIYRLVQVKGTSEGARYTLSKRTTCTMLEILNLDKTETISIDSISNQDFMEDECKRLRQSIKCGFISRLTVGDILDKAMELQAARVNDWLETEVTRLNHLRDRASDMGRKKELRVCVEKLNLLKSPEERARRLEEIPLVHDDATMDPEYESDDDTDSDDKKPELYRRSDSLRFNKIGRDQFSPRGDYTSKESLSGTPRSCSSRNYEFGRNLSLNKNYSEDATTTSSYTENSRNRERNTSLVQQPKQIIVEKPKANVEESGPKVNETDKMWHYKDPSDKIQGPFSVVQLRKWSKNGYFPRALKIWRKTDKEDDAILLSDALQGKFPNFDQNVDRTHGQPQLSNLDRANLPSPTPYKATSGWTGGQTGSHVVMQSPTPKSAHLAVSVGPSPGSVGLNTVSGVVAVAPQTVDQGGQLVAPPQMAQGWGGAVQQNMQPNASMNIAAGPQQMAYNQWTGVPAGNYMQMPQEQWGQPNMSWGPMMPTPNMGWVQGAPNPGTPMNWGPQPMVQGGNVDPTWAMQGGWVPQPPVQGVLPNQNWVGNGNPGWVGPPGAQSNVGWGAPNSGWVGGPPVNQGANNMGWVPPPGPPPPQGGNSNSNQNWGSWN